jgi:hypothetical protein
MEIGKIDLSKIKLKRPKLGWGWRYIDASIVVMGMLIAILVWFIPSLDQNKDLKEYVAKRERILANNAKVEAAEARIKKEEEELGIVWVPPPKDLVVPKPGPVKSTPPAKPAPAKKPG